MSRNGSSDTLDIIQFGGHPSARTGHNDSVGTTPFHSLNSQTRKIRFPGGYGVLHTNIRHDFRTQPWTTQCPSISKKRVCLALNQPLISPCGACEYIHSNK